MACVYNSARTEIRSLGPPCDLSHPLALDGRHLKAQSVIAGNTLDHGAAQAIPIKINVHSTTRLLRALAAHCAGGACFCLSQLRHYVVRASSLAYLLACFLAEKDKKSFFDEKILIFLHVLIIHVCALQIYLFSSPSIIPFDLKDNSSSSLLLIFLHVLIIS